MKIEDIIEAWKKDCVIDQTSIGDESLNTAKLHAKYASLWTSEKIRLHQYYRQFKALKAEKEDFFFNPTSEKVKEGWKIPPKGKLLKSEIPRFVEYDSDVLDMELKIGVQQEKIELLKSILGQISTRGFAIKNMLEDRRFMNGG